MQERLKALLMWTWCFAGIAMNPARDFGPRLVHWILPIPGKGSSEWDYSWIPVTAGLVGGVAGAAMYKGINEISLHTLK